MTTPDYDFEFRIVEQDYKLRLMIVEAELMQSITGAENMIEFTHRVQALDARCLRALVWIARKRQEPTLKYEDVDFPLGEFRKPLDQPAPSDVPPPPPGGGTPGKSQSGGPGTAEV